MLDRVMDIEGQVNDDLGWRAYIQTSEGLTNVNYLHRVPFYREYAPQLKAGEPLAGYLATTVISPDERETVIQFRSGGSVELYLNGQRVEQMPMEVEEEEAAHPLFRQVHETAVTRLRAGRNTLVVDTRPPQEGPPTWFFGGAFTTPDGDLMTALIYE